MALGIELMVELISVSRNYETNQKMIQTIDGTLEIAANQLGKI
jgi:flagellar basal-body rod protein FlgG